MEDQRASGEIEKPVNSLADLHLAQETLDSVLCHIGRLGVEALDGWGAAGTTLVERDKVATFGVTDQSVNSVDQFQYDARQGPCVDALSGEVHYFDGRDVRPEWQEFARKAADCGIHSVVSFPLRLGGDVFGALNFYSKKPDALQQGQREEGAVFAAQAAVILSNMKTLDDVSSQADQLEEALKTRTMIGQATGLLMAHEGLTSEEAFQKLVKVSQNANVKLREIAQRYVDTWESKGRA